jgi:hypothetical protein
MPKVFPSQQSVRGEREGERGGGTGPRARCFPLSSSSPNTSRGRWRGGSLRPAPRQLQPTLWVAERASGGGLCRPTTATQLARGSIAVPWREATTPIGRLVCQARGHEGGRSRHAVSTLPGASRRRTRPFGRHRRRADPRREQPPSRRDCAARNARAQGAARFLGSAPPARCAAHGLDRASRDPFSGNYRRPARKCLTTIGGGATV